MVSASLVLFLAASVAPSVLSYPKYSAEIPNGDAFGKEIGHAAKGYTPFGTFFSQKGKTWAGVCKEKWPGQTTVTVGAVLGDPCCKWTSGGKPDFTLSAPNLSGTVCASAATTTAGKTTTTPTAPASSAPATPPAAPLTTIAPSPSAGASGAKPGPPAGTPVTKPTTPTGGKANSYTPAPASNPAPPPAGTVGLPSGLAPSGGSPISIIVTPPVAVPASAPIVAPTTNNNTGSIATPPAGKPSGKAHPLCAN